MTKKKPKIRRGRPPKEIASRTAMAREIILKNPTMKMGAVCDIANQNLPSDSEKISHSLVNQTNKKIPSFFLKEATRIGLPINKLIEFLKICEQWPSERVAENLESRCYKINKNKSSQSTPTALSDIRNRVLSQIAKNNHLGEI